MVQRISEKGLLEMKEMDERLSITMNFYRIMGHAVYFGKPEMIPFVSSRMVLLTMENGLCEHSILSFVQFAAMLCSSKIAKKSIERASQIGKAAMSCSRPLALTQGIIFFFKCVGGRARPAPYPPPTPWSLLRLLRLRTSTCT